MTIGEKCFIGVGARIRGDYGTIVIGSRTSVQENVVVHARDGDRTVVGDNVQLGHGCILHNCTIKDNAIIGVGAIISDYAVVGDWAIIVETAGVEKIYGPGWPLDAIAADMTERIAARAAEKPEPPDPTALAGGPPSPIHLTRLLTMAEHAAEELGKTFHQWLLSGEAGAARVVAVAGDGGSGKSTLIDERVRHFLESFPEKKIPVRPTGSGSLPGCATSGSGTARTRRFFWRS